MAIAQRQGHDPSSPQEQEDHPSFLFDDALYCEEDRFDEEDDDEVDGIQTTAAESSVDRQQDPSWEEDDVEEEAELLSLLSKERGARQDVGEDGCALAAARREAVEWMLGVWGVYGFSALTAVLAVDYLDRFLSGSRPQRDNKPWMTQLVAVACLSLSAKVEETHVPLLLDLQVRPPREKGNKEHSIALTETNHKKTFSEVKSLSCFDRYSRVLRHKTFSFIMRTATVDVTNACVRGGCQVGDARYVFEAKTVQRMELLVLSTLGWEMHPVTPLSFVHHIARRLGPGRGAHREFLRRCERLLVAAVSGKCGREAKHTHGSHLFLPPLPIPPSPITKRG